MMGTKFQPIIPLLLLWAGYIMLCWLDFQVVWSNVPHLFCFGIMLSPDVGLTLAVFLIVFQWHVIFLPFNVLGWFYLLSVANFQETFCEDFKLSSEVWLFSAVNCRCLCLFIYDSVDHVTSPKAFKFLKIFCWLASASSHVSIKSIMT